MQLTESGTKNAARCYSEMESTFTRKISSMVQADTNCYNDPVVNTQENIGSCPEQYAFDDSEYICVLIVEAQEDLGATLVQGSVIPSPEFNVLDIQTVGPVSTSADSLTSTTQSTPQDVSTFRTVSTTTADSSIATTTSSASTLIPS